MKNLLLFFTIIAAQNVFAETYKCTDANGKKVYSQIPCSVDAVKIDVEESEHRRLQVEAGIALKELQEAERQRKEYELKKEAERAWLDSELVRTQHQIIQNQRALEAQNRATQQKIEDSSFHHTVTCLPNILGRIDCF